MTGKCDHLDQIGFVKTILGLNIKDFLHCLYETELKVAFEKDCNKK